MMSGSRLLIISLILLLSATPFTIKAQPIVADLAVHSVDIDHDFTGLDILLFGARNDVGNIVIVLRGPKKDYVVRKKDRIAGIWVNRESVIFKDVYAFYALAASSSLTKVRNDQLLSSLGIGVDHLEFETDSFMPDINNFKQALIYSKQKDGLFTKKQEEVTFWGETLFRTVLRFPKNIEKGDYTAEIYLFDDGILSAVQSTPIKVRKTGFEALIFDLAHTNTLLYGLLCIAIALVAGFGANRLFGKI